MSPWLAALLGCDGSGDKPRPEPSSTEPATWQSAPAPGPDLDGDGFRDEEDCAPRDPLSFPGAEERCNGLDDDCDGQLDPDWDRDVDSDGFLWCQECDDERPERYPGAPDPPGDLLDDDCDGTDGVGTALPAPLRVGQHSRRNAGMALAGGDVDGDGCAELLIGEPGGWTAPPAQDDAAVLGLGCYPWAGELPSYTSSAWGMGKDVDLALGLMAIWEGSWQSPRGRVLVFDETFGPQAEPLLEVQGGDLISEGPMVDGMTLLGDPAQWLLIGSQHSPATDRDARFLLVDLQRRGVVRLDAEGPDLIVETNTDAFIPDRLGDVGDRDGDGEVDLGLMTDAELRLVYFFPQVTGGHVDDAPEIWTEAAPELFVSHTLCSGGDLDGDGRSEAVYASLNADGQEAGAGRAFLVPWLGSGEFDLDTHAPTRLDGEFTYDWFGYDSEVSDLDGDGQADLLIGAPGSFSYDNLPGKVAVFSGPLPVGTLTVADAAVLWVGEQPGDNAGAAIATGDFDGSGHRDVAIGAPFADRDGLSEAGAVYVLLDPL